MWKVDDRRIKKDGYPIPSPLDIGVHRPVYLWGGPGTVRMNRLKFMGAPVDEAVHEESHTPEGVRRMAEEAAFSWAYLMYNWGFPPEVEQQDWAEFRRAVEVYQRAGMRVFGYVQLSNCVYSGSFRDRDWYALDPKGRPFYYYTGRYMTCWAHPGWLDHLRGIVRGIVEAGADGVFFDNPWHGIQPLNLGGVWMGAAGCYCARCQAAFRQATGMEMPTQIAPESDGVSHSYLRWRAEQVTDTMAMLADYARSLNREVVISANDFDAVMRPSYLIYGIDLRALAGVQDVVMIEDYGLPRWVDGVDSRAPVLVNNALTLRTARALIGDTPLSTNPYDQGIGFDGVYPPHRFRQGIAEAAACGATMVVKGTEYVEDGEFTLLTAERFGPQREAIGDLHRWLAEQAGLYQGRENAARVGLLHPGDALWQAWGQLAPLYFGAGQTLLAEGIPWRVVARREHLADLDLLLCFDPAPDEDAMPPGLRLVSVSELPGWAPRPQSVLARYRRLRLMASRLVGWLFQSYFRRRWWRQLVDRLGLQHFFWQSPFFRLPPVPAQEALLEALGERPYPRVRSGIPVLVEAWRRGEGWQLHLVNYGSKPQPVTVEFGQPVRGTILSADEPADAVFEGLSVEIELDVYTVLDYKE
jgi:hypothetical protein